MPFTDEPSPAQNVPAMPNTERPAMREGMAQSLVAAPIESRNRSREQARILKVSLDSLEDFAYVFDRAGRFVFSNQSLLRLLGISLAEIVGKNFFDLNYPPDLAARLQQQIEKVFDSHQIVRDETPFVNAAGKTGFYEYIFSPVFDPDGGVQFVSGVTRDVSEYKRAELERESLVQQLVAERTKLDYLIAKEPACVATLSGPEHIFEMTNPAYLQLIGHADVIGKSVLEAVPEVEGQGFLELLDAVFQSGESFTGKELSIQLQRQPQAPLEERFLDFVYHPILDAAGKVTGIFVHGTDITEQVLARKEAENANRAKDEFLATLSHELRSPLSAIMGWASILQSGETTAEENALGLSTIARNARAQHQLIEDILDVSRMIADKTNLEIQSVDLRVIVEEELNTILPASQTKKIHFQSSLAHGASMVEGDPARLQQIVRNLLSNALKFTPQGGHVQVSLKRFEAHVEIAVADSGIGMTPEMLPCVFDRFRQADATSTRAQGGLGLGLAIVQHLVELHGGSIQAHSEGLGLGATFSVRLPLIAAQVTNAARDETYIGERVIGERVNPKPDSLWNQGSTPRLEGAHILVVEDQEDTRKFIEILLEKCGARVTSVASAAQAFAALQAFRPDVLLSDIGMPGEDGFSLIARVRALAPEHGGQTPAVALTAFVRPEDRAEVLRSGFQAHLAKPISPFELTTVIATFAPAQAAGKSDGI